MNILIIEDEEKLALGLQSILQSEGYNVCVSYDGADGLNRLTDGDFDVVLLDINIPRLDGFAILKYVSLHSIKIPIIVLSARSDIEDKLRGLSSGAIDYITKPFDTRELLARIKLRTGVLNIYDKYKLGDLDLDAATYSLRCKDAVLPLTNKEFVILEHLFLNAGIIQKREILISKIWHDEPIDDRTLDVYISMIRKKMDYLGSEVTISTKRSVGYVLKERGTDG